MNRSANRALAALAAFVLSLGSIGVIVDLPSAQAHGAAQSPLPVQA